MAVCPYCNKQYKNKNSLTNHISLQHRNWSPVFLLQFHMEPGLRNSKTNNGKNRYQWVSFEISRNKNFPVWQSRTTGKAFWKWFRVLIKSRTTVVYCQRGSIIFTSNSSCMSSLTLFVVLSPPTVKINSNLSPAVANKKRQGKVSSSSSITYYGQGPHCFLPTQLVLVIFSIIEFHLS